MFTCIGALGNKKEKKKKKQQNDVNTRILFTINLKHFWLANPTKWQDCAKKNYSPEICELSYMAKVDIKKMRWKTRRMEEDKEEKEVRPWDIFFSLSLFTTTTTIQYFFMSLQYVFIILQSPNSSLLFFMNYSCEFYLTSVCTFFPLLLLSIQVHKYLFYIYTVSSVVHHKLKIHMCLQKEVDT